MSRVYNQLFGIAINRANGREQSASENSPLLPGAARSLRQFDRIHEDDRDTGSLRSRSRSVRVFSLQRPGFIPRNVSQAWRAIVPFLLGSELRFVFSCFQLF